MFGTYTATPTLSYYKFLKYFLFLDADQFQNEFQGNQLGF